MLAATMHVFFNLAGIALGVGILVKSADGFTNAAVEMARRLRVPDIVVGATLVSLATTLPEFGVSLAATLQGQVDMAMGNAVGSVICNSGLVLGLCAVLAPMGIDRAGFLANTVALLVFGVLFAFCGRLFPDGSRVTGIVMLACLTAYLAHTLRASLKARDLANLDAVASQAMTSARMYLLFAVGAMGIALGSRLLVYCGENLARLLGVAELVISLTVLAVGTSTPELAVSVAGVIRKRRALAIGNIIGANILNLAWVIGTCSLVRPLPLRSVVLFGRHVHQSLVFDIPVMLLMTALVLVFGLTDKRLTRTEGAILFAVYLLYVGTLYTVFRAPQA